MADAQRREHKRVLPDILIPYRGLDADLRDAQDIFIYMRPETNGIRCESMIVKAIESSPLYRTAIQLVYMANIPGEFVREQRLLERHYAHKIMFAAHDKSVFTEHMRNKFSEHFNIDFDDAPIIGAFSALRALDMSADELFNQWVNRSKMIVVNGQSIKYINGYYVVNYDIPALLHKHTSETDIAVMLFRVRASYKEFREISNNIYDTLSQNDVLKKGSHHSRIFHYSKSPFEQLLDGIGYLLYPDGSHVELRDMPFAHYLISHGVPLQKIHDAIKRPIVRFRDSNNQLSECHLMVFTENYSYEESYNMLGSIEKHCQFPL